ncbi:unnamed protein product [Nezara viridula]|uniref:Lipocalin/cytosolic fatty-acid binding domain-containing protein n=1 Tax=Nezara viridula TaxID=85310 RepID=A0A9P0HER5_NEZVI|nr:unnamed protein product [Nezara viridula]
MELKIYICAGVLGFIAVAQAQIPGLGWCPDKRAMPGFDIDKYLGTWYEAERYFTVLEAGSRCARTNYTKAAGGIILVTNEITNRLTGIKRVLDGEIRNIPKGGVESKISVKYTTLPFPMETEYIILDTDYDSYSVVWSCSGLGILNTQSAWLMTRERLPPGTVLQKAYAVLDKHKISRTFFVRAEQEECNIGEAAPAETTATQTRAADPEPKPEAKPEAKPEPEPAPQPEPSSTEAAVTVSNSIPSSEPEPQPSQPVAVEQPAPVEPEKRPSPAVSAPTPVPESSS